MPSGPVDRPQIRAVLLFGLKVMHDATISPLIL